MIGTIQRQSGALRAAAGGRALEMVWKSHAGAAQQTRWLSASPALRAGHLVTFGRSSSPELQNILDTLYNQIVLPSYLPNEQQKKIYNEKHKQALENDPVTMEIDGVIHKFRYVDRMRLPVTMDLVRDAIKLIKTRGDFDNVPKVLEGLVHAHRRVDPWVFVYLIRKAEELDRLDVIVNSVKAVKRTGFKLSHAEIINEMLVAIQLRAIRARFDKKKTEHALKQTQNVVAALETDKELHHNRRGALDHAFFLDPLVLAARLHMAAALAVHHNGGKDVDRKVTEYASQLMYIWKEGKGVLDVYEGAQYRDRDKVRYLMDQNNFLWHVSPVLNGLNLAAQVVDPGLAMQLRNRADAVDAEIRDAWQSDKRKPGGRGEKMYNLIFNPEEAQVAEEAEEASA
ncbi:hypothetical protein QBC42DRAFT_272819 [Cladorrhinum samala]|uniref:Uncharacterized protein n=1 Tax=Cladorrhinum samala TaxID=585594 RepID=A0AAV9HJG8_9PEZI|nr:hypothetical protein QBC42DRAFT_272819 [Cladorrhinum samala]